MQHLDEGTIHAWLDGALSTDEATRVSEHVEECPQCAAAVAEARGFIAASSRILTALDNVPRGVVPVGSRVKPRNWAMWRAAAAVLVVALGSFAVLRERMGTQSTAAEIGSFSAQPADAGGIADRASIDTVQRETLPASQAPTTKVLAKPAAPVRTTNPSAFGKIENQGTLERGSAAAPAAVSPPPAAMAGAAAESRADNAAPQSAGAATMKVAAEPLSGHVAGVAMRVRAGGAAMSDAAVGPTSIRVVGTPRVIGEKRTLYEVAPGDTVLLAEATGIALNSVVVTGATRVAQSPDTSAGARATLERSPSRPVASENQRGNAAPSPAAPAVPATAPPPAVQTLNGITTLTWTDPASGNTMKLSGRHSAAELIEIRRKIEQLRSADAEAKKKP